MGILKGTSCSVTDDHGHKMLVSTPMKGTIIFYPHKDAVVLTYEEVRDMFETLTNESISDARITIDIPEVTIND